VLGDSSAGCAGGASVGTEQQKAAASKGPARSAVRHAVKAKEHKAKASRHEKASLARKAEVKKAVPHPLKPVQAASLGTLPVSGVFGLVQPLLHNISVLSDVSTTAAHVVTTKLPASKLAALDASVASQPMSDNSLTALAVGALLTGAAALKVAGRGARSRKASSDTGSEEAKA
jgi:hypothetical protein